MLGDPRGGSKVWEALDREIGKPGENRGQIVAHWEFQPAAAFHDRENRRNLGSRLWTATPRPHRDLKPKRMTVNFVKRELNATIADLSEPNAGSPTNLN